MGRTAFGVGAVGFALLACVVGGLTQPARAQFGGNDADELRRLDELRQLQQLEIDTRLRANEAVPVGQRALVDYGGFFVFDYLSLDDNQSDNHGLREYDLIAYARANFDGAHELFFRGSGGWRDFNEGDSFDGLGDEKVDPDLDSGYYRFDLARARAAYEGKPTTGPNFVFQGGRDFTYWANGVVLAQTLDGVKVDIGDDRLMLEGLAGVTRTRTVDFDTSRPEFDHNTRRGFYGAMLTAGLAGGEHRPFLYFLSQRDYNQDDGVTLGLIETNFEYQSYYVGAGSNGNLGDRLRYGVEFVYEFGSSLSNSFTTTGLGGLIPVTQTEDDIDAYALDVRLDYLLNDPNQTRLGTEFIMATGDDDRGQTNATFNGNTPGTTDRAFNAFGLLNTGLAFSPEVSNILALRLGAATFPLPDSGIFRRMQIGTDLFVFGKFDQDAPIDEFTGDHRYLGWEPDFYINWQLTSDVTLALRYGLFFPNSDNFVNDDTRQFFFGGLTFAF
jgi:hypothetical protein